MASANYYSKRELAKIGIDGFALIDDEFYGRKGTRKPRPNYAAAYATYRETSRPSTPPPPSPPAMGVGFQADSSGGNSRKLQQICSYPYSPAESLVCWTPVVAATTETTTVIRGYEAAGKLQGGGATLMDNYYNQH